MPFVLKHKKTAEIFACRLLNHYDLPFYGVKFWTDPRQAEEEAEEFIKTHLAGDAGEWAIVGIEEGRLKLLNVKLANDERRKIYLDEQGSITVTRPSPP